MTSIAIAFSLLTLAATQDDRRIVIEHDGQQVFCATDGPSVMGFDSGPYNFTGTCGAPPPGACDGPEGLTRLTRSTISYGVYPVPYRPNVDLTEWDNIWGHGTALASEPIAPWPGVNGAGPVIRQFGRHSFLAAHFNTGSNDFPTYGFLAYASNIGGPNVDIRISQTCGDFSSNAANPACLVQAASDDSPAIRWKFGAGNTGSYCNLAPNTDYYINVKYHDPASAIECPVGASACPFYTVNNGNW